MAASSSEVLREYLIALGWRIDQQGAKKFGTTVTGVEKTLNGLAKAAFAAGSAAAAMVSSFVYNMEKLYYASKRIGASVGNIQALEYGAEQIGISGETMRASLEGMAKAIRLNPGIPALIKSFGIPVEGRDMSDVMRDTVKVLSSMPHYVGSQFAAMFGLDEQSFLQMKDNMAVLDAAIARRKEMASAFGINSDEAAAASKDLMNTWRELVEFGKLFSDQLTISSLPVLKEIAGVTKSLLMDWTKIVRETNGATGGNTLWERLKDGFKSMVGLSTTGGGVKLTADAAKRARLTSSGVVTDEVKPGGETMDERTARLAKLAALEQKYGLPQGILGRVWKAESSEGKNMTSPAGAQGHFQFMPGAAADYGLKDPNDFDQSADAAARYYRNMMKKYGGDARMAAAAYNWGPGNVDRYGIGAAPKETQDYMNKVAPQVNQKTEINIAGVESPQEAARLVANSQERVNADLVRNLGGASQ